MPEVVIKYKNEKTLDALKGLAKYFDFVVEKPKSKKIAKTSRKTDLPITFAEMPDITALAGIWSGKDISQKELRKKAWGNRL